MLLAGDRHPCIIPGYRSGSPPAGAQGRQLDHEEYAGSQRIFLLQKILPPSGEQDSDLALGAGNDALRSRCTVQIHIDKDRATNVMRKVLIIVENLPVPFDGRVWKEA